MSLRFAAAPLAAGRGAAPALGAIRAAQLEARRPVLAAEAFLARGRAAGGLDALLAGRALAVTTGQQAGLFTGPLYAVHKALTAAALADALAAAWGVPVVPVFWVAGDDHDFAEVQGCAVLGLDGAPARVVLRERPAGAAMRPVFREPLGEEVLSALDRLEAALPPSEFRAGVLEWLRGTYRPERSLAEGFAEAIAALLGDVGVVVLRGWHAATKRAGGGVLRGALERGADLDRALATEATALRAAGHESPVAVGEGLALVMLEASAGRDRLRLAARGEFETRRGGERVTLQELLSVLEEDPERLSANVLLRPVLEAAIVPTVAYVGGPGELAYLPQTRPLFEALGVPRPAPLPRVAGALVDARTDKTLARTGLTVEDLARPEHEVVAAIARDALPPSAAAALSGARAALGEAFAPLAREAAAIDPTLGRPVEAARNQALAATQEIEKKLVAALKRSSETAVQQVVRARAALWPDGVPQERLLTYASFAARHGAETLAVLAAAARRHVDALLEANVRQA